MIEMLGVLAIIGILSVGGIWGYNQAMENYKINQTMKDIADIHSRISSIFTKPVNTVLYAKNTDFYALGILDANKYPKASNYAIKSHVIHLFGKELFISIRNFSSTTARFGLTNGQIAYIGVPATASSFWFYNIPKNFCVKVLTKDWYASFQQPVMVGKATGNSASPYAYYKTPLTVDEADSICKDNTTIYLYIFFHYSDFYIA